MATLCMHSHAGAWERGVTFREHVRKNVRFRKACKKTAPGYSGAVFLVPSLQRGNAYGIDGQKPLPRLEKTHASVSGQVKACKSLLPTRRQGVLFCRVGRHRFREIPRSHAPAWECIRNKRAEAITSSGENTHIGEWAGKSLQILASHEEAGVLFCRVGRHRFREITHGHTLHAFPRSSVGMHTE